MGAAQAKRSFGAKDDAPRHFEEYLSRRWSEGCVRGRRLFQEIKARGYKGSFSNLERLLAKWRNRKRKTVKTASTVPNPPPVDPATGRSISRIVAAALCLKPRGLLTANQAAKIDAMNKDWPEFSAMRRLAMRFRGMLKSKNISKPGAWLKDVQKSGLYAIQRFARTLQRDIVTLHVNERMRSFAHVAAAYLRIIFELLVLFA